MRLIAVIFGSCILVYIFFAVGPIGWILGSGILLGLIIYGILLLREIKGQLRVKRDFKAENRKIINDNDKIQNEEAIDRQT
ncbi:hypothetical protein [Paenibacillus rigui]|uniref:Uncharacterized protein n=1 Tax=Paenibacillus rigui TaxID=554312 RepID=A0A229UGD5_9BACL|nr:hypothetical protein [Paenibacillus rigui]OXM82456.1 hypothetical protein CF651_30895 [Paenibacillus rigui]